MFNFQTITGVCTQTGCVVWAINGGDRSTGWPVVMRIGSRKTRNVLDCDKSNYSSRIIFSYAFTLEPNTNWIGWTVSEIWPFKIIQDSWRKWSWIWSNRKQRHSIRRSRKPYPTTKREVDRTIRCRDMAVRNLPKSEVGRSLVGRRSSIYTLLSYTPLR